MQTFDSESVRIPRSEQLLGWIVSICGFLFPIIVLTVNHGDSLILLVLVLVGIYATLRLGVRNIALSRQELTLMSVFVIWYSIIVISYFAGDQTDTGFKMLGRNLRIAMFVPAFIAARQYLNKPRLFMVGVSLAPISVLAISLWQSRHGLVRVSGFVDVIPFGDLSLVMAFMSMAFLLTCDSKRYKWRYYAAAVTLVAGIVTSVLSESRGGWLALPVLILISSVVLSKKSQRRGIKAFILLCAVGGMAALVVPRSIILDRVGAALDNVHQYVQYIHVVNTGELKQMGCIQDPDLLRIVAKQAHLSRKDGIDIQVVSTGSAVSRECGGKSAIRIADESNAESAYVILQRFVFNPSGKQRVDLLAKGQGMLAINGMRAGGAKFDNTNFEPVQAVQDVGPVRRAVPYIFVTPHHPVLIVPVQNQVGEYIYPLINNSVAQRLEMWRAAWFVFSDHFLIGSGTGSYLDELERMSRDGRISPTVTSYDHPHNDYLNSLSGQGLLGFGAYLLALIYPLILFMRFVGRENGYQRAAAFSGLIMVSGLLISGLTETMFIHSIVMDWYVVFTAFLVAVIFRNKDAEKSDDTV